MGDELERQEGMFEEEPDGKVGNPIICDRCGFEMHEKNCKVVCSNCGNQFDCSDLNIYFD
jgi:uncharacterized Zn finger protein (UPF0148 family)